jgi:hypothetical protein
MEGILQNNAVYLPVVGEGDGGIGVLLLEVANEV